MLGEKMQKALDHARATMGVRTQKEFALSVGMPADRLRNIVNGKIQKLQPEEAGVIQRVYNIRSAWWFSDMAPMLLTDQEQALQPAVSELSNATAEVLSLGLETDRALLVQEVLFFVRAKNTKALNDLLDNLLPPAGPLQNNSEAHEDFLQDWHSCTPEDKKLLLLLLKRLSQGVGMLQESGAYKPHESNPAYVLHDTNLKG